MFLDLDDLDVPFESSFCLGDLAKVEEVLQQKVNSVVIVLERPCNLRNAWTVLRTGKEYEGICRIRREFCTFAWKLCIAEGLSWLQRCLNVSSVANRFTDVLV